MVIDAVAADSLQRPWDRWEYMYACYRTCRAWRRRAAIHLYQSIHLHVDNIESFVKALKASPFFGAQVEQLTLDGEHCKYAHRLSVFPRYIPYLAPNITRLDMKHVNFHDVHPTFFWSLRSLTNVVTLECEAAQFRTLHQPNHLFSAFCHLKFAVISDSRLLKDVTVAPTQGCLKIPDVSFGRNAPSPALAGLFSTATAISIRLPRAEDYEQLVSLMSKFHNLRTLNMEISFKQYSKFKTLRPEVHFFVRH